MDVVVCTCTICIYIYMYIYIYISHLKWTAPITCYENTSHALQKLKMKSFAVNSSRDIFFVTRTEVASNCKLDAIVVPTEAKDKIITPLQDVWTQVLRQP